MFSKEQLTRIGTVNVCSTGTYAGRAIDDFVSCGVYITAALASSNILYFVISDKPRPRATKFKYNQFNQFNQFVPITNNTQHMVKYLRRFHVSWDEIRTVCANIGTAVL